MFHLIHTQNDWKGDMFLRAGNRLVPPRQKGLSPKWFRQANR